MTENPVSPGSQVKGTFEWAADVNVPSIDDLTRISETMKRASESLHLPSSASVGHMIELFPELRMLTGNVNATPEGITAFESGKTLSESIYGEKHIEFDRTLSGIMILNWVLKGDYQALTECQNDEVKLSRDSFVELQEYTLSILQDPGATQALMTYLVISNAAKVRADSLDAMVAYMALNDLTKIQAVVDEVKEKWKIEDVDHDKALLQALTQHPEISPSFLRLDDEFKGLIINGLGAEFNFGQFIQGECPAAHLLGLNGLNKRSLDFYMLHAFCDIAGAAGHVKQNGSLVMTEPTFKSFMAGIQSLQKLGNGATATETYDSYLSKKALQYGLNIGNPHERAITRAACMLRVPDKSKANDLKAAYQSLPGNAKAILAKELKQSGVDDGFAILPYYAPALLANLQSTDNGNPAGGSFESAAATGLYTLSRIMQEGRIAVKNREGNGIYTVLIREIAEAAKTPEKLEDSEISLQTIGSDAEASLKKYPVLTTPKLKHNSLSDLITGDKIAAVGIGGGTDGMQAAVLAEISKSQGKDVSCIISVRTGKTQSQGVNEAAGKKRTISNAIEIVEGVYRLNENSNAPGRFPERLAASGSIPVYTVLDLEDGSLKEMLEAAIKDAGGADQMITIDTGGDSLYSATVDEKSKATPDQDLRVLETVDSLGITTTSFIVAAGIDSPPDANSKLSGAEYYELNPEEQELVLNTYKSWHIDGSSDTDYGKTPLAWQSALQGEYGVTCIPLPEHAVTDSKNPWNPFIFVQPAMKGIFVFSDTSDHLQAIA